MANGDKNPDGRSSYARGYVLASRVMSIGITMALPAVLGYWADGRFGTTPWLLLGGTVLGFALSMIELVALAKEAEKSDD